MIVLDKCETPRLNGVIFGLFADGSKSTPRRLADE
jgi:hypothetical protein